MRRTILLFGMSVALAAAGCAARPRTPPPPPPFPPQGNLPPGAIVVPPGQSPFPTVPNGRSQQFQQAPPPGFQQSPPQSFPQVPPGFQQQPPSFQPQQPPGFQPQQPPSFQPQQPPSFQPSPSFPQAPSGPSVPPSVPMVPQGVPPVPQPPPGPDPLLGPQSGSGAGPLEQAGYNWKPSQAKPSSPGGPSLESQVLLLPPEPAPGGTKEPPVIRFYQDDSAKDAARPPLQPAGKQPPPSIPGFQSVRKNVESGSRPFTPEGFDWLAANGYKTVLFLRFPGSSDEVDRKLVTDRKMEFLSLEVKPNELLERDRDMMKEFFRHVQTGSLQPMYVYGQEEMLAGGMWFLVFRLIERDTEEVALVRASALGLRPGEGAAKETFDHFVRAGKAE